MKEVVFGPELSGIRCLFWSANVTARPDGSMDWKIHMLDEAVAQRFFPLDLAPDLRYDSAWYLSRLPEDRERTDHYGNQEIQAGRSYSQEFRCRRKDGEIRWLHEDVQVETLATGRWR